MSRSVLSLVQESDQIIKVCAHPHSNTHTQKERDERDHFPSFSSKDELTYFEENVVTNVFRSSCKTTNVRWIDSLFLKHMFWNDDLTVGLQQQQQQHINSCQYRHSFK
jgi:hypothetical protein